MHVLKSLDSTESTLVSSNLEGPLYPGAAATVESSWRDFYVTHKLTCLALNDHLALFILQ